MTGTRNVSVQGTWNLLDKIVSSSSENSTRRKFWRTRCMPDSKKDSQRIRQTYNLTQGHREPAKNASARLCAQQLSAQPWTTWPYWWSLWRRSSTRSDSLHLPPSLSLTSISNTLVSDGTCAPIATLRLSRLTGDRKMGGREGRECGGGFSTHCFVSFSQLLLLRSSKAPPSFSLFHFFSLYFSSSPILYLNISP